MATNTKIVTTPGPIAAVGTYLYQLSGPPANGIGNGCNLWGGHLQAHNGFSEEHLLKAVKLMLAAQSLLDALQMARNGLAWYQENTDLADGCDDEAMAQIDAAIAKATS